MPIEAVRHAVSRLWLYAFAGIVAAVCATPYARASGPVAVADENATGAFSQATGGREPIRAFLTDLGVYELDKYIKCVRIWQRGGDGTELFRPPNSAAFIPYTSQQLEVARPRPQRFMGIDADGNGITFKQPVGMDLHPDGGKFAVVSAGEYMNQGLNQYCPSIQVYEISETASEDDGTLSEVLVSLAAEYANAFHETTNGWRQVLDRVYQYPDVLVTTNFYSDGTIRSVTTNTFVNYTTNLLDRTFGTNWVYIAATNGEGDVTLSYTNGQSRTGQTEPVWWNPLNTALLVPGFEYTLVLTNDWISVTTNYYSLTNYVFEPVGITTNANYLATATDVAFLGDEGLVASITSEDYQAVRSAFLVFGSDPAAPAKLFPVEGLDKAIQGIAVDRDGNIYAAVPDMAAVFRFPPPDATADGVGGTPGGWLALEDRTPVFHDDFVAGVTNAPGSTPGRLSSPADVSVWYPEEEPFLLVADSANNRIQMFDPNSLSWTETNWLGANMPRVPSSPNGLLPVFAEELGTTIQIDPATGLPFDPDIIPFVETNGMSVVTNYYHVPAFIPYVSTNGNGVVTNYYRLETTAFPVFSTEGAGCLSADPPKGPKGAWGQDGTTSFVLADTGRRRIRVLDIEDLSAIDSDEILAMAVWWPAAGGTAQGLAARDMAVTDGSLVWWDALVPDAAVEKVHVVREHETYEHELRFTVSPARHDRTYTLSVEGAAGVVDPVQATATIPAGSTEGVFTFAARDGIVSTETLVSWRDRYGNQVPEGDPKAVRSAEEQVFVSPVYTLSVSSGGFSTNALLAVENVDPIVTNAQMIGYVIPGLPPTAFVLGFHVDAADASGADDSSLTYLWWASTNVNWAINNRDWAVTNHDWAASAGGDWSEAPSFPAGQYTTASAITGTETAGLVTNTVSLLVARGKEVRLPPYEFNQTRIDEEGYPIASEPGTTPFYVVCTVLDKDGGHTILSFPTPSEPSGYAGIWAGVYDRDVEPEESSSSDVAYEARFVDVSGTNVTFVVTLVPGSGDPLASDTVSLETATSLGGPWTKLGSSKKVGDKFLSGQTSVEVNVTPAGSGEVRFYRVVRP